MRFLSLGAVGGSRSSKGTTLRASSYLKRFIRKNILGSKQSKHNVSIAKVLIRSASGIVLTGAARSGSSGPSRQRVLVAGCDSPEWKRAI
jgi:hypothetical protein